jgi:hypothetical protein
LLLRILAATLVATAGCASASNNGLYVAPTPPEDASTDDANAAGDRADPVDVLVEREASFDGQKDTSAETSGDLLEVHPAQFTQESMPMRMLYDGDPVDLWSAPQGGEVVLFGAKVKHMSSEFADLKVRFRRPDTGLIVAEERRSVKMVPVPDEPGVFQPDISSFSQVANVPLCPSIMAEGIVDLPFDVEVFVTALYTQPVETGTCKVRVVARCPTGGEQCRCECGPNYYLGKCSGSPDGGPRFPEAGGLGPD